MTKTTPRGSDTISADEGNEVNEVLTWSRGKKKKLINNPE